MMQSVRETLDRFLRQVRERLTQWRRRLRR